MKSMVNFWLRFFYAQGYAFAKSQAYLASQRGDGVMAGEWNTRADGWYLQWWRVGREL